MPSSSISGSDRRDVALLSVVCTDEDRRYHEEIISPSVNKPPSQHEFVVVEGLPLPAVEGSCPSSGSHPVVVFDRRGDIVGEQGRSKSRVVENARDEHEERVFLPQPVQTKRGDLHVRHIGLPEFYANTIAPERAIFFFTSMLLAIWFVSMWITSRDVWWIIFSLSFLASAVAYLFHMLIQRPGPVLMMDSRDTFPRSLSRFLAGYVRPPRTNLEDGTLHPTLSLPCYFRVAHRGMEGWEIVMELSLASENKHERAASWESWKMAWWPKTANGGGGPTAAQVHGAFRAAAAGLRTLQEFRFGDSSWFENKRVLAATYVAAKDYERYYCADDHPLWRVLRNESETTWVHWEGPPGSGKTSGALFLAAQLHSTSAVVLVSHREIKGCGKDGPEFFFAQLRSEVLAKLSSGEDVLIIIDESQVLVDDVDGAPAAHKKVNEHFEALVLDLFNILPPRAVLCTLTNDVLGDLEFSPRLRSRLSRHLIPAAGEPPELTDKEILDIVASKHNLKREDALAIVQQLKRRSNKDQPIVSARDLMKRVGVMSPETV